MSDVLKYYENYDEDKRLGKSNLHKIEYLTTIHFLDRIIPPNSKILDVCAGTGIYSFYLEGKGHSVTAVDIVPRFVEIMEDKKKRLSSKINIYLGDARNLNKLDLENYDIVLCMGALYHLHQDNDRRKVIEQCLNILKEDGILASSYINRHASFISEFKRMDKELDREALNEIFNKGHNLDEKMSSFYLSSSQEMNKLMNEFNIEKIADIGSDGIGYMLSDKIHNLSDEEYQFWLDYHYKTCQDESLIGYSLHGLYIGRKKK